VLIAGNMLLVVEQPAANFTPGVRAADRQVPGHPAAIGAARARGEDSCGRGRRQSGRDRPSYQVHGAIGFTHEHSLHRVTRRLWSWRDEFGTESHWSRELGKEVSAAGADTLWPMITAG
jgi:hypothetical protein